MKFQVGLLYEKRAPNSKTVFYKTSGTGNPAPSIVSGQTAHAGTTSSVGSAAPAFPSNTTAGNLIVVVTNSRNHLVSSITDDASGGSNTYVQAGANQGPTSNNCIGIWYAKNAKAAKNITATWSGNDTYTNAFIYEVQGADKTNPYDNQRGSSGTSTTASTGTIKLSTANEIIIAGGSVGTPPATGGAGYTNTNYSVTGDATLFFFSEYHAVTADEAATTTQTSSFWIISGAAFRADTTDSMTLPADMTAPWQLIAIGGGSGGSKGNEVNHAWAGGAGGAFSSITDSDASASAGQTVYFNIGAGSGNQGAANDTWLNLTSNAVPTLTSQGVVAKGGGAASGATGGIGGASASGVGSTKNSGGNGGAGNAATGNSSGAGGGAAAGAQGNGGNGAAAVASSVDGGEGGGGSGGGGSGTVGQDGHGNTSTSGGDGGNNAAGVGHGVHGSPGGAGTLGGGGAGANTGGAGGAGGPGADYTQTSDSSTAGPGGGGGSAGATSGTSLDSGDGGLYGGGGAGGTAGVSRPGVGKDGVIILIYTPI